MTSIYYLDRKGRTSITYAEALDVALCYGWIDDQKQRGDAESRLQKFTWRGAHSPWSKIYVVHVERLIREERMKPAGLVAVESAKADGRWANAYGSSSALKMPGEFKEALACSPKAAAFFVTLNRANR